MVTHDQDLIDISDTIYKLNGKNLELKKESYSQFQNFSKHSEISKLLLFKTRLYSHSFFHMLLITILLSTILLGIANFIYEKEKMIDHKLINGIRQEIIVYSLIEPTLDLDYCHIEPYYFYKYNEYTFINQALPITLNESKKHYFKHIEYYQDDSINYVKKIDSSFLKIQVGYLLTFDDVNLYHTILKQLSNQYSTKDIQSLYLEKQNIVTLEIEKTVIINFYYVCIFIITFLLAFFYCKKTQYQNINYVLLLDLMGYTNKTKLFFFFYEASINIFVAHLILYFYPLEWGVLCIFIAIYYGNFINGLHKEFSYLYRTNKHMITN